jgi:uncharacterized membrane protein
MGFLGDQRNTNVGGHRFAMRLTYGFALIVAGLFTLAPGRASCTP